MSLDQYEHQLAQVEATLLITNDTQEKENLLSLKQDLLQLINLTKEDNDSKSSDNPLDNEYAQFMSEMISEGAIDCNENDSESGDGDNIKESLKNLEGMKCKAPHLHTWGNTVYHNAMICSISTEDFDPNKIMVKVMYINPTHQEMIPCPYFLETDCKFSEEKCRFSHGELVEFSQIQDYEDPSFDRLEIGSVVLAKRPDKLWHRAQIKRLLDNGKSIVKFESNVKDVELDLKDILPLDNSEIKELLSGDSSDSDDNLEESEEENEDNLDIINMSLMVTPSGQKLGEWEKFTKGIGSKLMRNMGYIIGSGLGKSGEGIVDPVSAVIVPKGKSLDHCMLLRENAGGDKDLFSAERKLKKLQKLAEERSEKQYQREKNKVDVFKVINTVLDLTGDDTVASSSKSDHRQEIRKETTRNLNVESLKIDESIKQAEKNLFVLTESLKRHRDVNSKIYKGLRMKQEIVLSEINDLKSKAVNITNEQNMRSDKKKLTVF